MKIMNITSWAFALFAFACFALAPQARAACQEGCLTGGNTVLGDDALLNNTGPGNTAIGVNALFANTFGNGNAAIGQGALYANTIGSANTATGQSALYANTTGADNAATGALALESNTTGFWNTANGYGALAFNTCGISNIAVGANAGINLTTGDNNIDIGNQGVAGESGTIRIGTVGTQTATYIAGIRETELVRGTPVAVGITPDGQLGVRVSSARFKEAIKPMNKASEAIFSLQPVSFRYKNDPELVPQFGLVAEDVAKVNSHLVVTDVEGKPFTVRYDEINAMLLNEFLKEHRKVQELEAKLAKQEKDFTARLHEQDAKIQQVSAQLELSKPVLQTIANNQ